ncbi:MAG: hypothetical protein C0393_05905, partial [Anaerolinea sp.]|nr:hypothetical protein [Anaerolinea sp.]
MVISLPKAYSAKAKFLTRRRQDAKKNKNCFKSIIMPQTPVYPLDLNFLKRKGTIAAYLVPTSCGAVLVESGPGSTLE